MFDKGKPESRVFVRLKPSGLMSKTGVLVLDKKQPAVPCNIVDISRGGACLQLPKPVQMPKRFVFVHAGVKKSCHLIWQKFDRIGVGF
jgi:hypothetical protein